ncbi:hypothetical protein PV10_02217 [Exophiala mesophila]|uniref:Uncharacterized protein n=1 Tax=Exophiala mesophila TaxID=212818 RepID=A0A0D1WYB9_EXOME|nr:uncharacterized protein PV10_02217 [Exophiala mesophila]KIV94450.1 hypothetical protein PV10_02217 [Exophiala mesophila]
MADSAQSKSVLDLTPREQEVVIYAMLNLKCGEDFQVDNAALAKALGLKNAASAATCWCNVKKKLFANKNNSVGAGDSGAVSATPTKAKTPRAKPTPKSKKGAISEPTVEQSGDSDENNDAKPTSPAGEEPPATPTAQAKAAATKKRGRKTKAEKAAEAAAALETTDDAASNTQAQDDDDDEAEKQPPAKKQRKAPLKKPVPQPDEETIEGEDADANANANASASSVAKPKAVRKPRKAPTKKSTLSEVTVIEDDDDGEAADVQLTSATATGSQAVEEIVETELMSLAAQAIIAGEKHSVSAEDPEAWTHTAVVVAASCGNTSDADTIVVN